MPTRRRYTRTQKAEAVGIATASGVTEAERQTGIPKTTIQYWSERPEFVQLRTKTAEAVAEEMWAAMQTGLRRMVELIPLTDDVAKVGVAVGILYDKRALLTGGATERTETHDWTITDHETVDRANALVLEELGRRADSRSAVDAVGGTGETGAEGTPG